MSALRMASDLSLHWLLRMYSRSSCAARTPILFSLKSACTEHNRRAFPSALALTRGNLAIVLSCECQTVLTRPLPAGRVSLWEGYRTKSAPAEPQRLNPVTLTTDHSRKSKKNNISLFKYLPYLVLITAWYDMSADNTRTTICFPYELLIPSVASPKTMLSPHW